MYFHKITTFSKFMLEKNELQWWSGQLDATQIPQPQKPNLTPEQQKVFESVESIQKAIEEWKAGEKIVWGRANIIWAGLEKIKAGLIPNASVDDPEYKELLQTYNRLVKEYQDIAKQQSQNSRVLDYYVAQVDGKKEQEPQTPQTQPPVAPQVETPQAEPQTAPQPQTLQAGTPWAIPVETPSEKPKEAQPQSTELTKEQQEKIDAEIKAEADKIAEQYKFNKDTFYKAVKEEGITYNPKIKPEDEEGENATLERAKQKILDLAERLRDVESMKNPPVTEEEKKNLSQDQQALRLLPEAVAIEKIQSEIDELRKKSQSLQGRIDQETDESKRKELEARQKELSNQIKVKEKELDSKKTPEYKRLEKKIEEGQNKIEQEMVAGYKRNPQAYASRVARETTKSGPNNIAALIINEVFKKVFGIDLYATTNGGTTLWNDFDNSNLIWGSASTELGSLSEQFESGWKGPYEITPNDDNQGFPSYGTYQFNRDTLQQFATHMWITGNCREVWMDTAFAKAWKEKISQVWVQKFKEEERAFAKKVYFEPQMARIKSATWADTSKFSLAMQNVVWSSAIQHGQNTDLVVNVLNKYFEGKTKDWNQEVEKEIINKIYDARLARWPEGVKRYSQERKIALAQLSYPTWGVANVPDGWVLSYPATRNPVTQVTQCSGTAALNAARFWIQAPKGDARQVENSYGSRLSGTPQSDAKVLDIFSNSIRYPQYGHRAIAYKQGDAWFVLDPYLPAAANGERSQKPIPLQDYTRYLDSRGRGPARFAKLW